MTHYLMVDIRLENNIKVIALRSTLNIENHTNLAVEMIVIDSHGKADRGGAVKIRMSFHLPRRPHLNSSPG